MVGTVDDYYSTGWLKSEELKEDAKLTIRGVKPEKIGTETKLVLSFDEIDKGLVLNKTNANRMVKLTGTKKYSEWVGEVITLYTILTNYKDEEVKAIRIKVEEEEAKEPDEPEEIKDEDE